MSAKVHLETTVISYVTAWPSRDIVYADRTSLPGGGPSAACYLYVGGADGGVTHGSRPYY